MASDALPVGWDELRRMYPELLSSCKARIDRWAFAPYDADWESPYELWAARGGTAPRRREVPTPEEPEKWGKIVRYGYDGDGDLVLAQRFIVINRTPTVENEALWTTVDGRPSFILRSYPPSRDEIIKYAIPHRADGRLHRVDTWYHDGRHSCETYTYDEDERLTLIALDDGDRFRVSYDEDGELAIIWASVLEHDEGRESVAYRRKRPGDVVKAYREAEELLFDGVRRWAERQDVKTAVRLLVLGYGFPPNDVLPPPLGLGQVDDTVVAEVASGQYDWASLYSVADQGILDSVPVEFDDDVPAFQRLNQEWRSTNDSEAVRLLLLSVAKRLNQENWASTFAALDPNFAVIAVDLELSDLERNLRELGVHRGGD